MRAATTLLLLAAIGCRGSAPTLPILPSPPPSLPPLDDIVRACAFEVSCLHDPPAATMRNCIVYLMQGLEGLPAFFVPRWIGADELHRYVDCARVGSDCGGVLACATLGHDAAYCAAHPGTSCDGSLLVPCPPATATPDAALFTVDCAARGLRCVAANGGASCSDDVACDPKSPPSCDGNRYFEYCDATTARRYRVDCARSPVADATCRSDGHVVGCWPSGAPCTADRCDGDTLVRCLAGEEAPLDCAQLASTCGDDAGHPACLPIATDCTYATADACLGSEVTTCLAGMIERVDCSTLTLRTCTPTVPAQIPICTN